MRKILALLLIVLLSLSAVPAYAAPLIKSFTFEGFEADEPAQNTDGWTWITTNQWEYWYTDQKFKDTDSWLEPAARTGDVTGTALRFFTKDGTTPYNAADYNPLFYRGNGIPVNTESQFSVDWMIEDLNAGHYIQMQIKKVGDGAHGYHLPFKIDTTGRLLTFGVDTGITIVPGEWHNYEMILSKTEGLFMYLDDVPVHIDPSFKCADIGLSYFHQELQNDGNGFFKGSAMQIDNLKYVMLYEGDPLFDKRLFGISDATFTEETDSISASVPVYNYDSLPVPYLAILSVYNAEGAYVGYNVSENFVMSGASMDTASVSVSYPEWGAGYSAKLHILKSWNDRNALKNVIFTYGE